jgi:hypothetical protein
VAQPEARLQKRCRMFLNSHLLPPSDWSSVRHERKQSLKQGADQKALGVKRGLPDVMIWAPSYFMAVELKSAKGRPSPDQYAFQAKMAALGHGYAFVRSVEQLGEQLVQNGIRLAPNWRLAAMHHDAALDTEPKPKRKPSKPRQAKPTRARVARWNEAMLAMAKGGGE